MNIAYLQLGFGQEVPDQISLNIYFSGCKSNKQCEREKCQNQQLHSFTYGTDYTNWLQKIDKILNGTLVKCIVLLGGEPLDQSIDEFNKLMLYLQQYSKPIYLYTGYTMDKITRDLSCFENVFFGPYREGKPELQKWLK